MATVVEKFGRRETLTRAERFYVVYDALTLEAAKSAIIAAAPTYVAGFPQEDVEVEDLDVEAGTYLASVRWSYRAPGGAGAATGVPVLSFNTSGGSQRLTQSLSTVNSYGAPGFTAPNFRGAINASDQGVEGVDVVVPVFEWSETHRFDDSDVTWSYLTTLRNATGKVNSSTFRTQSGGEVLFLGAEGTLLSTGEWEITFRFAAQDNQTGLSVGTITGIDKQGWDYLWVWYRPYLDATTNLIYQVPTAAYVERVYRRTDFADLDIGTDPLD